MTRHPPMAAVRSARVKLLVVLPLTMALLVAATGFFVLSTGGVEGPLLSQLGLQVAWISAIAAILGLSIAFGVTRPVRDVTTQLEALASGDLRGGLHIASASELDSLGDAFNEAVSALQRSFFQSMTGAVITLDAEGRVIGSSTGAEETLGYREGDLTGKRFSDIFTAAPGSRASLAAIEAALGRRDPVAASDLEIIAADGRPIRIGLSASYLQQSGDDERACDVIGVTLAFKDLGQMRSLQARLKQAEQLMTLGTVTAGVAHEIRNPLSSLRGLAELLGRDMPADDSRRRYIETMLHSISRMHRLTEDLLLLSAPRPAQFEQIDLLDAVAEAVSLARYGLGDRRVTLNSPEGPEGRPVVLGSRERLAQLLTNITLNAIQATPEDGVVTVRTSVRDGVAAVAIHNTGSFIPPAARAQLFVPFFTTKPSGTGLGLAIARQIATAMDGRIDVASDPRTGTTFTAALPVVATRAARREGREDAGLLTVGLEREHAAVNV